tara:strand:+ start:577 stop:1404 length:828 start_codon:yes stop_codon:yes gene_type:complete
MSKEINDIIKDAIVNNRPLSVGKMGNVESFYLLQYLNQQGFVFPKNDGYNGYALFVSAGVCTPTEGDLVSWCKQYFESVKNLDYILNWHPQDESVIANFFTKEQVFTSFQGLEPFIFGKDGWHHHLHDKKVLCVSPFPKTVQQQAEKFDKIWDGATIGELKTIASPPSDAWAGVEDPKSWQYKTQDMIQQINDTDFDFATVGCGGVSLLLCDHIKKMGKPCVHLGGGNQILYGIMGKRWDEGFKEHEWYGTPEWTRPLPEEIPEFSHIMEFGCYW